MVPVVKSLEEQGSCAYPPSLFIPTCSNRRERRENVAMGSVARFGLLSLASGPSFSSSLVVSRSSQNETSLSLTPAEPKVY